MHEKKTQSLAKCRQTGRTALLEMFVWNLGLLLSGTGQRSKHNVELKESATTAQRPGQGPRAKQGFELPQSQRSYGRAFRVANGRGSVLSSQLLKSNSLLCSPSQPPGDDALDVRKMIPLGKEPFPTTQSPKTDGMGLMISIGFWDI